MLLSWFLCFFFVFAFFFASFFLLDRFFLCFLSCRLHLLCLLLSFFLKASLFLLLVSLCCACSSVALSRLSRLKWCARLCLFELCVGLWFSAYLNSRTNIKFSIDKYILKGILGITSNYFPFKEFWGFKNQLQDSGQRALSHCRVFWALVSLLRRFSQQDNCVRWLQEPNIVLDEELLVEHNFMIMYHLGSQGKADALSQWSLMAPYLGVPTFNHQKEVLLSHDYCHGWLEML